MPTIQEARSYQRAVRLGLGVQIDYMSRTRAQRAQLRERKRWALARRIRWAQVHNAKVAPEYYPMALGWIPLRGRRR